MTHCDGGFAHGDHDVSATALAVLAFQNHAYLLPNDDTPVDELDIFQRFIVQRGLTTWLKVSACSTRRADQRQPLRRCRSRGRVRGDGGLRRPGRLHRRRSRYSTAVAALPFAASDALTRTSPGSAPAMTAVTNGRDIGAILERIVSTIAWVRLISMSL